MGGLKTGDDVVVLWFWFSGGGFGFSWGWFGGDVGGWF